MTKFTITGNGYSGSFNGDENFIKAARRVLLDVKLTTQDLFKLKSIQDYIDVLKENNFEVKKELTVYDAAIEEAPHLGKYIREMEKEGEDRIPASAQITKIKIGKGEKNATVLYQKNGSKASKEVTFKGYEDAVEDFLVDFREMSVHIIETLSFPEEWLARMTTTGLSITWKDEQIMGMVITAQLEISGLNAPFNLNTPFIELYSWHMASDNSCNEVYFSEACEELLEKIIVHAKKYMNGLNDSPVQTSLPLGG